MGGRIRHHIVLTVSLVAHRDAGAPLEYAIDGIMFRPYWSQRPGEIFNVFPILKA